MFCPLNWLRITHFCRILGSYVVPLLVSIPAHENSILFEPSTQESLLLGGELVLVLSNNIQLVAVDYCYFSAFDTHFNRYSFLGRETESNENSFNNGSEFFSHPSVLSPPIKTPTLLSPCSSLILVTNTRSLLQNIYPLSFAYHYRCSSYDGMDLRGPYFGNNINIDKL